MRTYVRHGRLLARRPARGWQVDGIDRARGGNALLNSRLLGCEGGCDLHPSSATPGARRPSPGPPRAARRRRAVGAADRRARRPEPDYGAPLVARIPTADVSRSSPVGVRRAAPGCRHRARLSTSRADAPPGAGGGRLSMSALPVASRFRPSAAGEGAARGGGRWLRSQVRLRGPSCCPALSPPRPGREGIPRRAAGRNPLARSYPGRGTEVRSPLRQLPRRDRGIEINHLDSASAPPFDVVHAAVPG